MRRHRGKPLVCSIGTTDPTAGAGLFADAAVYSRLGVAATFVVAGVTAQNSRRVFAVYAVPGAAIEAQLQAVWAQARPSAVRIGLMPNAAATRTVARFFRALPKRPRIILDPVIAATSGYRFAGRDEIAALRAMLSLVTVATPNAREAAKLARIAVDDVTGAERAALQLAKAGAAVLVKGGHLRSGDRVVDVLAQGARITRFSSSRLALDMRGTGCILSAALAAALAEGELLETAIKRARTFLRKSIATAQPLGRGRPQLCAGVRAAPV